MTLDKPLWTPWSAADARACIWLPTDQDHKYTRGLLAAISLALRALLGLGTLVR